MQSNKKVLLIDGSSLAFRMYFALERTSLTAPDGRPSWAIFGFLKALMEVIIKEKPTVIITAFDAKGKTFREEKFDYYKANRPTEMPEDLALQWPEIIKALKLIGMPVIEYAGLEADDIVGTLSNIATTSNWETLILSGDRDTFQLVNKSVQVLYPGQKGLDKYDTEGVKTKMGVYPDQIIDYKALAGDSSDNISGIKGIGDKTAVNLLNEFKTLDQIYKNLDNIKPAVKLKLETGKQDAMDSKYLAEIKLDCKEVEFDFTKEDHRPKPDSVGLKKFVDEYKLTSLQKMLPHVLEVLGSEKLDLFEEEKMAEVDLIENKKQSFEVKIIPTEEKKVVEKALLGISKSSLLGVYLSFQDKELFSIGISYEHEDKQIGLEFNLSQGLEIGLSEQELIELIANFLATHRQTIYWWDIKQAYKILSKYNLKLEGTNLDVLLGSYIENSTQKLDLKTLVETKLGITDFKPQAGFESVYVLLLGKNLESNLVKSLHKLWLEIENPLAMVLAKMELNGVYLDQKQLESISKELADYIQKYEKEIKTELGNPEINIASTQQLGQALAAKGYKLGKTSGGGVSTDRGTLDKLLLGDESGLIAKIIEHRTLSKLKSTYTDTLVKMIDPKDKRLHGEFNQTIAATGRLSSANPNMQNIPIKNAQYGKLIRSCFASEVGNTLIAADYSQIELRFLAHFSKDPVLLESFEKGQDVHARTAAELFEIPLDSVTGEQRRLGKTLNFALVYQQGAYATAQMLGISNKEGVEFMKKYFQKLPRVKPYVDEVLEKAKQDGFVETFWGRRRYFKNLNSPAVMLRKIDERAAFNAVLQGSNADLIKIAMINLQNRFEKEKLEAKIILQVHDELVVEVKESLAEKVKKIMLQEMVLDQPLIVPIVVEAGIGKNWAECKG